MTESAFVFDVTQSSYDQQVLENSHRVPVLVDFWADWCGPCKMQLPVLLKLVEEYRGKFLLAKIDTDAERALAQQHNIRSIPTLKLFRDGQVVEEILGGQTESTLRTLLDKYVTRESDNLREAALQQIATGNSDAALAILRDAVIKDPDNPRAQLDYMRTAMEAGSIDEATQAMESMPREIREGVEIRRLAALLDFARKTQGAPARDELERRIAAHPDDCAAREQLAARLAVLGDIEDALEQYLEILRHDRNYGDDAGRKGMLMLFELLGNQGPLVNQYRSQMFNLLH